MRRQILIFATLFLISCVKKEEVAKIPILIDKEAKAEGFNIFHVPVRLEGIEKEFKMQFDLGLDVSVVYSGALKSISKEYSNIQDQVFKREDYKILKSRLCFSNTQIGIDSLFIFEEYDEEVDFKDLNNIGSVGLNQFKGRILLINYKELYLQVYNDIKQLEIEKFDLSPLEITNNKLIVKLKAGSEVADFLFDTGNGVPLLTVNKNFFDQQTANQKELRDTITGNSWGETISLFGAKQQKVIGLGNTNLETGDNRMYYTEATRIVDLYKDLKIEHSIGNNLFMDKTIVFDFKNNQFGIMK